MNITEQMPKHVAIIMDGNGRWASKRNLPTIAGHKAGAEALRKIIEHAGKRGISYLTVYAFSTENWRRQQSWIEEFLNLLMFYLKNESKHLIKNGIKLKILGDVSKFSQSVQSHIQKAEHLTKDGASVQLNIALNHGGRDDIKRMVQKMIHNGVKSEDVTESLISDFLDTHSMPDPDLMIRTGGDLRISNFLLWQLAYTEFIFVSTLWPDFGVKEFDDAIETFHNRQRRFGQ